jgi:hypothetical protein
MPPSSSGTPSRIYAIGIGQQAFDPLGLDGAQITVLVPGGGPYGEPNASVTFEDIGALDAATWLGLHPQPLIDSLDSLNGGTRCYFNGEAGSPADRFALRTLAAAYRIPFRVKLPSGGFTDFLEPELRRGLLVRALHAAVTKSPRDIVAEGFSGLVQVTEGEPRAMTPGLWNLLHDERFVGQPDNDSACADLLDRLGDPDRAAQLRKLITLWIRNRLWTDNFVPELVLHDENHSMAVDRNVAFLCETLTDPLSVPVENASEQLGPSSGTSTPLRLSTRDLFILAVAAWLHDWGHASIPQGGYIERDPFTVREQHGAFTRVRLLDQSWSQLHGLSDLWDPCVDEVAVICGHHQASSSLSDKKASGRAFTEAIQAVPGGSDKDAIAKRLKVLTALFRVADAADVGVHRAPHLLVDHCRVEVERMAADLKSPTARPSGKGASAAELALRFYDRVEVPPDLDFAQCDKFITGERQRVHYREKNNRDKDPAYPKEAADRDKPECRLWRYVSRVKESSWHFAHHRRFLAVVPTLDQGSDSQLRLKFYAVLSTDADAKRARRDYQGMILREFGYVLAGGEARHPQGRFCDTAQVEDSLKDLGIVDVGKPQEFGPHILVQPDVPISVPADDAGSCHAAATPGADPTRVNGLPADSGFGLPEDVIDRQWAAVLGPEDSVFWLTSLGGTRVNVADRPSAMIPGENLAVSSSGEWVAAVQPGLEPRLRLWRRTRGNDTGIRYERCAWESAKQLTDLRSTSVVEFVVEEQDGEVKALVRHGRVLQAVVWNTAGERTRVSPTWRKPDDFSRILDFFPGLEDPNALRGGTSALPAAVDVLAGPDRVLAAAVTTDGTGDVVSFDAADATRGSYGRPGPPLVAIDALAWLRGAQADPVLIVTRGRSIEMYHRADDAWTPWRPTHV